MVYESLESRIDDLSLSSVEGLLDWLAENKNGDIILCLVILINVL